MERVRKQKRNLEMDEYTATMKFWSLLNSP